MYPRIPWELVADPWVCGAQFGNHSDRRQEFWQQLLDVCLF